MGRETVSNVTSNWVKRSPSLFKPGIAGKSFSMLNPFTRDGKLMLKFYLDGSLGPLYIQVAAV